MDYVAAVSTTANDVFVDGSKLIKYVDGSADVTLANKAGGTWTLTEDGKALKSVADLLAAYEADKSAQDSLTSAEASLAEAIAAVYGKENGGYADANESGIVWFTSSAASGKNVYTPDYTKAATIYKTAQDAENGAGVNQVYKFTIDTAASTGDEITFDGVTIIVGATTTAAQIATDLSTVLIASATDSGLAWTAAAVESVITLTAGTKDNTVDPDLSVEKRAAGTVAATKDSFTDGDGSGTKATFVFTLTAGVKAGDTIIFGDKSYTFAADHATATAAADELNTKIITAAKADGNVDPKNWTASNVGATVTLTASDNTALGIAVGDVLFTPTPRDAGTIAISSNSTTTEGVKTGETLALSKDAALSKAVVDAKDAIASFDKKVAEFEDARDIKAKIKDFDTDLDTVNKWFSDNGYKTVDLTDSATAKTATKDSDIFFISKMSTDKDAAVINSFGKQGDDYLVAGSKFANLSIVDSTLDITKAKLGGDAAKFDVFAQQSGDNTILYFETNEVAGNVVDTQNYIKVTLNGVTAEDLALSDGFITLA